MAIVGTDSDSDLIELACQGLEGAVRWYMKKYTRASADEQQQRRHVDHLTKHACHILRVLTRQRTSLQYAIHALHHECWKDCQTALIHAKLNNLSVVLTHVFYHFLRIRDGLVLVTSGECRHAGDASNHQNKNFPSRFSSLAERSDGYTKLYKSELGYSGASWDELFDEHVGVRHLLIRHLQRFSGKSGAWDVLIDHGAQLFESELDKHEILMRKCIDELEHWRNAWVRDLKRLLDKYANGGKVKMSIQDKMERLEVTLTAPANGVSHIVVERRANEFHVTDKGGVLPHGWQQSEWKRSMMLPEEAKTINNCDNVATKKARKRRLVIDDSSDEDGVVKTVKQKIGLKVRMEAKRDLEPTENKSLNEIKRSFGVNAIELQTAREAVENEENCQFVESTNVLNPSSLDNSNEASELNEEIHAGRLLVTRYRRIVEHAKENEDNFEMWDAREMLRESMMSLGSSILSLANLSSADSDDRSKLLAEASDLFRGATDIVKELEKSQETIINEATEDSRKIRRTLILLRGRALTNHGIALQQLSELSKALYKGNLASDAIDVFKQALTCTKGVRKSAGIDKSSAMEAAFDVLQADQLESLTGRWLGISLWKSGHRDAAVETLLSSSQLFCTDGSHDPELANLQILLTIDCYYCCVSLVDLASNALEKLPMARSDVVKWNETKQKGDDLLTIVMKAYKHTKLVICSLERLCGEKFESTSSDHSIITLAEIDLFSQELKNWWEAQKNDKAIPVRRGTSNLSRNDLITTDISMNNAISRQRFIVSNTTANRKLKKKRYEHAVDTRDFFYSPSETSRGSRGGETPKQYLKWGDELLPQVKDPSTGKLVPLISFPCAAPPFPPEMHALMVNGTSVLGIEWSNQHS